MRNSVIFQLLVAIALFCCAASAAKQSNRSGLAEDMDKVVTEYLKKQNLKKTDQAKVRKRWEKIIQKALSKVDLKNLDSKKRALILENFADYLRVGKIGRVPVASQERQKRIISEGVRKMVAGRRIIAAQKLKKINQQMNRYLTRCSALVLQKLRQADSFAVTPNRWEEIKTAYHQAVMSNTIFSYSMTEADRNECEKLTTENEELRSQYAKLFIYTQLMEAVCNRVKRNASYLDNLFIRPLYVDQLNQKQIEALVDGLFDIDKKIECQLETLLSEGTFYLPGSGGRLVGYWSAGLLSEKELAEKSSFDPEKAGEWIKIKNKK